jgi:hypothetical protein
MKNPVEHFGFDTRNYKFLFVGLAINVLGYVLMIGGGAENLNDFNANELFSTTRITISPMLIITGYVVILYSIMKRRSNSDDKVIENSKGEEVSFKHRKSK